MQQPLFFYAHSISSFTWTLSLTSSSTSGNFDFWQFRFLTALLAIVCSPGVSLAFHYAREGRIAQEARLSAVAGLYERPELRRGLLSAPASLMVSRPRVDKPVHRIGQASQLNSLVLILHTALPTLQPRRCAGYHERNYGMALWYISTMDFYMYTIWTLSDKALWYISTMDFYMYTIWALPDTAGRTRSWNG